MHHKGASANCETVFSGAGSMAKNAHTLGAGVFGANVFCHYNWKFMWLVPTDENIVVEYLGVYGKEWTLASWMPKVTTRTTIPSGLLLSLSCARALVCALSRVSPRTPLDYRQYMHWHHFL